MKTTFKTTGEKLWLVSACFLVFLIVFMLLDAVRSTVDYHKTPTIVGQQQTQTQNEKPSNRHGYGYDPVEEALRIKIMKENLDYKDIPFFAAGLIIYNEDCSHVEDVVMEEANKIAKERAGFDMNEALYNVKTLESRGPLGKAKFCGWFRETVLDKIRGVHMR